MSIAEYRRHLAEQLDRGAQDAFRPQHRSSAAADGQDNDAALREAVVARQRGSAGPARRAADVDDIVLDLSRQQDLIDVVIGIVRERVEPAPVRRAALAALRTISFRVAIFAAMRPAYLDALRAIVDDPDPELRLQAIETLAQEKDAYVQRRLVQGLRGHAEMLVSAEHAVEFLGYDVHAEHFPILRQLARESTIPAVKERAIQLLGSDPSSGPLLQTLFADKTQAVEVRTASAAALHALSPRHFAPIAARIAVDRDEDDRLRTASVSALDHFTESGSEDPDLLERIRLLQSTGSSELQATARRFVARRTK